MLGIPWNFHNEPEIDYSTGDVLVGNESQPLGNNLEDRVINGNIGVKKFRYIPRNKSKSNYLVLFQVSNLHIYDSIAEKEISIAPKDDSEVQNILARYSDVFRDDLPTGILPKRNVEHKVKTDSEVKMTHRQISHLSPEKLLAKK